MISAEHFLLGQKDRTNNISSSHCGWLVGKWPMADRYIVLWLATLLNVTAVMIRNMLRVITCWYIKIHYNALHSIHTAVTTVTTLSTTRLQQLQLPQLCLQQGYSSYNYHNSVYNKVTAVTTVILQHVGNNLKSSFLMLNIM